MTFIKSCVSCLLSQQRSKSYLSKVLLYKKNGNPVDVCQLESIPVNYNGEANKVLVSILASPIHPADINKLEGQYPNIEKTPFPIIGGTEGYGQVIASYESCPLKQGDNVVFVGGHRLGTWRDVGVFDIQNLHKIPSQYNLSPIMASQLIVNPLTAYLLIRNFVDLKPGSSLIQNGANSAVGQLVIQLAHTWNINTINVIRDRESPEKTEQLIGFLQAIGANCVLTESQLRSKLSEIKSKYGPIYLGLNCVGGQNCTDMLAYLINDSPPDSSLLTTSTVQSPTLVTYGGMSRKPVIIPTKQFIFSRLRAVGFILDTTIKSAGHNATPLVSAMIDEICRMISHGQLLMPKCKTFKLEDYKDAIKHAQTPATQEKTIFVNV